MKEIAKTVSGTVNDVVFAIVAGAVRECLANEAMLTDRPVIADTAAKNRREGDTRLWGNAVTVRRFELPTHLADPLERLRAAHVQSLSVKSQVAARHVQFEDWVALVPPILLRPVLRAVRTAAGRSRLSGYVMVSNVKGPREKRYIGGMGIENFISCGHLMFGPPFVADPSNKPVIDEWERRLRRCQRSGVSKAVLAVANRVPVEDEIEAINVATLVIVGADDAAIPPDNAQAIADRVPGARLEQIPSCGHTSTLEQPDTVTNLLRDFLSRSG